MLAGHLTIPEGATGIVVFVHGSGSSRHSPRNRYVAEQLNTAGLGTLLFDLLTSSEELDRANVFDIEKLASRLHRGNRVAAPPAGGAAGPSRLLRREHRRRRGVVGRCETGCRHCRGSLPRRPSRPGWRPARVGKRAHSADRRWPRRRRAWSEPSGSARAAVREPAGDRSRRHPPVRGTWCAAGRYRSGQRLVHPPPQQPVSRPAGQPTSANQPTSRPAPIHRSPRASATRGPAWPGPRVRGRYRDRR